MKQNSNVEVDYTLSGCVEKEVGISDVPKTEGNVQELSSEHEGERKETASSAVQEDKKMKEAVIKVENPPEAGKFDDKCIEEGSRKKKTVKILKVKRKIIKKSPASSVSRTKTAPTKQEDDKREKEAPVAPEMGENVEAPNPTKEKDVSVAQEVAKTPEVLKVKRKIIKKSPASSVSRTKEALNKQEDNKREKEAPVPQEMGETVEAPNPTKEKDVSVAQEVAKTPEVLKVKRKIIKKSPASSVSRTKKALNKQEDNKREKEAPVPQEMGETVEAPDPTKEKDVSVSQEVAKTPETQNPIENSNKLESTTKKVTKVLKVKRKIAKKSPASSQLKTNNKLESNPKVQTRNRRDNNKSALQANTEDGVKKVEDTKKPSQKVSVNRRISKEQLAEKGEETSTGHKNDLEFKSSTKERKNTEKVGSSNQKKEEKDIEQKITIEDKNEENLGGLIFLCSSKTKPDCLHYKVMGVPAGKKDVVLAIKPGLSLFLYDFDLRLLHGIYKASSSGGMSLEPKAFNGAFPAQVRFNVHKDCFPLPESIFKKAIEENYYEKRKFKTELTVKQVRKLSVLFRPVWLRPSSATDRSHPEVPIRDRKVHEKVKGTRIESSKSKGDVRNDHLSYRGRDRPRDEAPRQREEVPRDLFLSEKEYRTYGLRTERRNLDPVPRSYLETYNKDHERDYRLRHLEPSSQREVVCSDHVYFNGKDYPIYSVDSRSQISPPRAIPGSGLERTAYDSIYTRQYGLSSIDPYLLPSRREEAAAPPTYSRNYGVDTEPMRHAASALSSYNHVRPKDGEIDKMPAPSRYTFAGPSFSYR